MNDSQTQPLTLADALARLDENYELVYVDYRDELGPELVDAVIRGDLAEVWDHTAEWESESQWEGAQYVLRETFAEGELDNETESRVLDAILERDSSRWFDDLVRHTPSPLLRIECVDEDHAWSFEPVTPEDVLAAVGLDTTPHNVKTVAYALDNASPEFSVLMGYWIASVDLATVAGAPDDATFRIVDPHLYLGNPFAGSGFITEDALEGTIIVPRSELRTDSQAFGYSVDEVYGGLRSRDFESEIEVAE